MDSPPSDRFDMFEIYRRYSDIKARNLFHGSDGTDVVKFYRDALNELHSLVDKSMVSRDSIVDQLIKLMAQLNVKCLGGGLTYSCIFQDDFCEFSNFYEFVFFVSRENGQKNITVSRAIAAWKLVLFGRFRLLNQWCDFVEKNQRHNISEDTWGQVLAFSRCVHEDLEGYDPGGAWPVLIDDFVEHMYRITGSNCRISPDMACSCADPENPQSASDDTLPGLKSFPGLKRKLRGDDNHRKVGLDMSGGLSLESLSLDLNNGSKRRKEAMARSSKERNSKMRCPISPCAVEQCLSKGFEGLLSSKSHSPPLHFDPEI
ncbi:hypothetical protein V2J09_024154 [Rumex salicifolius]